MSGPAPEAVIIGGGVAGFRSAEALQQGGYPGPITVFSDDPLFACNRPVLSKTYLEGTAAEADLALRRRSENGYRVVNERVTHVDYAGGTVTAGGSTVRYDHLVLATGIAPQRLSGTGTGTGTTPHVSIRTLADVERLRSHVSAGARIAVVGGGTLALEIASSLTTLGAAPLLATRTHAPLARLIGPTLSAQIASRIVDSGIEWHVGPVEAVHGGIRVAGAEHTADVVVSAIGGMPETQLLHPFPTERHDGVVVTEAFRVAGLDDVWAVGDIAVWPDGRPHPHWFSAMESARVASQEILRSAGATVRQRAATAFVHSFWSDQWGLRIQAFGAAPAGLRDVVLAEGDDAVTVGLVDQHEVLRGVVSASPHGAPAPAMQWRAQLGSALHAA